MSTSDIPDRLRGKWAVISAISNVGEKWGGEILEEWEISTGEILSDSGRLEVRDLSEDATGRPTIILVNFTNGLQYAFLESPDHADVILVHAFGNGKEQMRYLITQKVYETPT